jgi:hypothetical protein
MTSTIAAVLHRPAHALHRPAQPHDVDHRSRMTSTSARIAPPAQPHDVDQRSRMTSTSAAATSAANEDLVH